jgi:hypothetical protein
MGMNATIESPRGTTVSNYQFQPRQTIYVKVSDATTFFAMGSEADVIISFADGSQALHQSHSLDFVANYTFTFVLPNTVTTGTINVTLNGIGAQENKELDIGVGTTGVTPKPPAPPDTLFSNVETVLKWVAIGAGVIAVAWLASKVVPSMIQSTKKPKL